MKQNIFETRQRSHELLEEAISIWRQSPLSDHLEGLEKDPVMGLLMSAIAYQANETDSDIELLKTEVLEEFVHMLTPYELGHAVPATAVIETALQGDIAEWMVDAGQAFKLAGTDYQFIPILRTKVINTYVKAITRLDGRRWKVDLEFKAPVKDLSGFTFAINNQWFEDVRVTYKNFPLPIIKPWHYSKLPLAKCFSQDAALYNGEHIFNASMIGMDLFARQNVRLFCIKEHDASQYMSEDTDKMSMVFEFTGITDNFAFDKRQLSLNCIPLAEAEICHTNISSEHPMVRLAGYEETDKVTKGSSQFLHLIRPSEEQIWHQASVEVRRVAGDRFNQGSLVRLLNALLTKYHTDFYAFQNQQELVDDDTMHRLQDILTRLIGVCQKDINRSMAGVWLLLKGKDSSADKQNVSLDISYLTTHGASVNSVLDENSTFVLPGAFDANIIRQIAAPVPGSDEVSDKNCEESLMRYHVITNDRIVTPADIKVFCYNELQTRYGIDHSMVKSIQVGHRLEANPHGCGYEILAEIVLADNPFVKRNFIDKIPQTEVLMQKQMEVRSANIYPIRVSITIAGSAPNDK